MIWTKEDDATLILQWKAGLPIKVIRNGLGRSQSSILRRRKVLGLPMRRKFVRTWCHVGMDAKLHAQASKISSNKGITLCEYIRQLLHRDAELQVGICISSISHYDERTVIDT